MTLATKEKDNFPAIIIHRSAEPASPAVSTHQNSISNGRCWSALKSVEVKACCCLASITALLIFGIYRTILGAEPDRL